MLNERDIRFLGEIFSSYNYIIAIVQLDAERLFYRDIQRMFEASVIEKVKRGYYHWVEGHDDSEVTLTDCPFPDIALCMETALFHCGYNNHSPAEWNITIDKNVSRNCINIDYPFVKTYHAESSLVALGETKGQTDFVDVRIYNHGRTTCDVLRNMSKMDGEIFNKVTQSYVKDPKRNVPSLMGYTKVLRVQKEVKELIGMWL